MLNAPSPALGVNLKDYDANQLLDGKLWRISEKIDGVRRLLYKTPNNKVFAYSRTGKPDIWIPHICEWLEQEYYPNDMIYDCELVDRESYFGNVDSFIIRTETNSKASQEYPDNKADLMAICFDMVKPDGDMTSGRDRTERLQCAFLGTPLHEPVIPVNIFGYIYGARDNIISALMSMVDARKGEGLMLMSMDSPYIPKRSKELIKIKRLQEFIGTIIDYEMARDDSKISGGIAALICRVDGCTVPVKVGTGFSHSLRQELADDRIVGTQIEIESFGKSKDRYGDISLNMPVFKQFVGV